MKFRMKLNLWERRKLSPEEAAEAAVELRDGCKHDWLNWTQPEKTEVAARVGFGYDIPAGEALVQTRACSKCNMVQRRYP